MWSVDEPNQPYGRQLCHTSATKLEDTTGLENVFHNTRVTCMCSYFIQLYSEGLIGQSLMIILTALKTGLHDSSTTILFIQHRKKVVVLFFSSDSGLVNRQAFLWCSTLNALCSSTRQQVRQEWYLQQHMNKVSILSALLLLHNLQHSPAMQLPHPSNSQQENK